ncbi:hypothetical protein BJY00DRAFT_326865 [Aspergillus carlsbadensis]|nr:hypothetical protein BJY00DRAFT_326865 [Aspergillus carlsbadensis]
MPTLPAWSILKGKTAAITEKSHNGTTGIGLAIALEFIRQGCNVVINHLGLPKDEHLHHSLLAEVEVLHKNGSSTGQVLELAGDAIGPQTLKDLVQAAVKQWGGLDIFQGGGGSIIAISSVSALVGGRLQNTLYANKSSGTIAHAIDESDKKAYLEGGIPLRGVGDPEDMAGPAVFLASEHMSRYANGSGLLADGGMFSN